MACTGDVPTLETLAPVSLFRRNLSDLKVRVVNVVDLMTLQPANEHRTAWMTHSFDALFTTNKPVIFTCHGYPWLIHRLTYRRRNHDNIHVIKKKEQPQRRSIWPSESNRPSPACAECVRRVPRLNRSGIDRRNPSRTPCAATCRKFATGSEISKTHVPRPRVIEAAPQARLRGMLKSNGPA